MKYQMVRKIISLISSFSLLFQSFLPLAIAMPVYADDASNSAVMEVTPTPEITPTVEPTPEATPEITPVITPTEEPTPEVTPDVLPTPEVTVAPVETITPEVTPETAPEVLSVSTETQNNSPPAETTPNEPTVTTDKADYAPTDTVQVAGMFFLANTPYTSTITSEDAGGYSNATNIITDETGAFFYLNPLDGTPRLNYLLEVIDSSKKIIASTTFTDPIPDTRVNICHWDEGHGGEYNQLEVNINSTAKCIDVNGHGADSHQDGKDIIPSFTYDSCSFSGKNISDYNSAFLANGCSAPADLKATKTNDLGSENAIVNQSFIWKIKVENIGLDDANFSHDEVILLDNLPNANVTYATPTFTYQDVFIHNGDHISCTIDSSKNLTCKADHNNDDNIAINPNGYIEVSIVTTFSSDGTFTNPRNSLVCQADPNSEVVDSNRANNNCSDTVTVSGPVNCAYHYSTCSATCGTGTKSLIIDTPASNGGTACPTEETISCGILPSCSCSDVDADGICDTQDNCPNTANSNQTDTDGDRVGNVCDNCPSNTNADQADENGDGTGDACTVERKVTICHYTSDNASHQLNESEVSINSVATSLDWLEGQNGHGSHGNDIWPQFNAKNGNLIAAYGDQTTLNNHCRPIVPVCGDGIRNGSEECDGSDGVTSGSNFCSTSCQLVPIYNGGDSCGEGMVRGDRIYSNLINSTDSDGEFLSLISGTKYLFEASQTFNPTSAPGYLSDAAFTWVNSVLSTAYGINGTAPDLGAHSLLGNLGLGVGIIKWNNISGNNYAFSYTPTNSSQQFVIGDRWDDWFNTDWQNQTGVGDNIGSLKLEVYECVEETPQCSQTQYLGEDEECHNKTPICNDESANNYERVTNETYADNNLCKYEQQTPVLTISKSNDSGIENPGGSVTYTIVVKALDNTSHNVNLIDLLPAGFKYRSGSWTANITGGSFDHTITEPVYASPGKWNLGDLTEGSEVTLTLIADISSDQNPGTYKDLALAYGCNSDVECNNVVASAVIPGKVDATFVGTEVDVIKDQTSGGTYDVEKKVEGQVLGASTSLPATGASPIWLMLAFISLVYGVRLIKSSNKSK